MKMLIGGKFIDSSDGAKMDVVNPATGKIVDTVPAGTLEDLDKAISLAVEGQKEWNAVPLHERLRILEKYACLMEESVEEISKVMCEEGGKPIEQCRTEVYANAAIFRIYCATAYTFYGKTLPYNGEPRSQGDVVMTIHEPLGVFANIVPFNYPCELAAHKLAPMLVTGNSVVLMPSSKTPRSAIMIVDRLYRAGVPANAICCVTGKGSLIGATAAVDPRVAAVSFTGSTGVGISLAETCAKTLRPVSLELGGNDPLIIFDDADYEKALNETVAGRIVNAGQTCCASKRFIVQKGIFDKFAKDLVARLSAVKVGNPADPSVEMGPCVREADAKEVERQIKLTIEQGGELLLGGKRNGAFVEPTVIKVPKDADIARDMECFGPVWPLIPFDTMDDAIEIANNTIFGLSSGVITSNVQVAMKVANRIEAGSCIIGGSGNYRLAHQPFGGYKYSGVGREGAVSTLEEMTQQKTIAFKGILND
ncbi:MAG: aldehyde dehydrogenase family protein [Lawsonibacter sp.]|jgi:acyl-CoA reductase-like NAD-dependent aldehyde dehydrogenase